MSVQVHYAIICDGCVKSCESTARGPGLQQSKVYNAARKESNRQQWIQKNEWGKGVKDYCPDCTYSLPEIAKWHALRTLTK